MHNYFRYSKKDRELAAQQKKYNDLEKQLAGLEGQLTSANAEKDKWEAECRVSESVIIA